VPAVSFLRWDYIYLIIFQTRKSYLIFLVTALKIKAGPVGQVALILRDKNIILHLYLLAGVLIFLPALLWKRRGWLNYHWLRYLGAELPRS